MKVFIICSKAFYDKIDKIKETLEEKGYEIILPNTYGNADAEKDAWNDGADKHFEFKSMMFKLSAEKIKSIDAVLVLNFDKHGVKNYIGGATFLEIYEAFMNNKKIYFYNPIPEGILYDELQGFNPTIINGNLDLVK